jgi:general stress protein YciG
MAKGFQVLTPERVREIARLGGIAAHARKTAHEFTHEEAVIAGRKGGLARAAKAAAEKANPSQLTLVHDGTSDTGLQQHN